MSAGGGRVTIFTNPDRQRAERLAEALRSELEPEVIAAGDGFAVTLPSEQIARGAELMATFTPLSADDKPPAPPAARKLFPVLALAGGLGAVGLVVASDNISAGLLLLAIAGGALKGLRALDLPNANRRTTFSLVMVAFAYCLSSILTGLHRLFGDPGGGPPLALAVGVGLLALSGLGLGVAGLLRGYREEERWGGGRSHGWWTVALGSLFLVAMGWGLHLRLRAAELSEGIASTGEWVSNEALNFKLKAPGKGWVQVDAKKLNPEAAVGFLGPAGHFFLVIAEEHDGSVDAESALELWRALLTQKDPAMTFEAPKPAQIGGLPGLEASSHVKLNGLDLFMVNRAYENHGYLYQLFTWAIAKEEEAVRRESRLLTESFVQIDPERTSPKSQTPPEVVERFSSPLGYVADLGAPWRDLPNLEQTFPSAEFGALCGEGTTLTVMAWPLLGVELPEDVLLRAMTSRLLIDPEAPGVDSALFKEGEFTGRVLKGARTHRGKRHSFVVRAVKNRSVAILVAQLTPSPVPTSDQGCASALEKVVFEKPQPGLVADPRQGNGVVLIVVAAADYAHRGQLTAGVRLSKKALALDPTSLDAAWTLATIAAKAGQLREAESALGRVLKKGLDNSPMHAVRAWVRSTRGDLKGALDEYERLFAAGYEDDDSFAAYTELLERQGQRGKALLELATYRQHRDTAKMAILEAELHQRAGNVPKALQILEQRLEAKDPDGEVALALLSLQSSAKQYMAAIDLAERLTTQGRGSTAISLMRAKNEIALSWYQRAKRTLEAAQRQAPGDTEVEHLLDQVSSLLGEGVNSSIKEPIEPVAIPKALLAEGAPPPEGDQRAVYLSQMTAISFISGKDYRTTERMKVRVLNQAGVELFSTLNFKLNPRTEGAYVNALNIYDEAGKLVRTGSAADCYLSDRASAEVGTSLRTLYVPIPGLRPGYTFELAMTKRALDAPEEIWFSKTFLTARIPAVTVGLFVRGDISRVRHFESGATAEPLEGGLSWVVRNPQLYSEEPFEPPAERFVPTVWLAPSEATWESELVAYLDEIKGAQVIAPEIEALSRQVTKGLTTAEAKVGALAGYLQKEVTYKAIEFGRGARIPRAPSEVLAKRYGDCKDLSLLLVQLLAVSGVTAELALVRSWGPVAHEVPSLDQFDHMIVHVSDVKPHFIDPTTKRASYVDGTGWLAGQESLLLTRGSARFVPIEAGEPPMDVELERHVQLDGERDLNVRETITARGSTAWMLRRVLGDAEASRRAERLQPWLGDVRLTSLEVEGLDAVENPVQLKLRYKVQGKIHAANEQLVAKLPAPWEVNSVTVRPVDSRKHPFELQPLSVRSQSTFSWPAGYRLATLTPATSTEEARAFGSWTVSVEAEAQVAKLRFNYDRRRSYHEAKDYAAFQRDAAAAVSAIEQPILLSAKVR